MQDTFTAKNRQIGWWDGSMSDDGMLTGVAVGEPDEPELWEPWARDRYTLPVFVKKERS
jgi:hypothetical protein